MHSHYSLFPERSSRQLDISGFIIFRHFTLNLSNRAETHRVGVAKVSDHHHRHVYLQMV